MSNLLTLFHSSVGKKFLVGATGLFLCTFLMVHVGGNLLLFKNDGGAAYNQFSAFMAGNPIIRTLEIVLFGGLLAHIITTIILWMRNKQARKTGYAVSGASANSALSSRLTFVSGSIVLFFLIVHMRQFWVPSRFLAEEDMYKLVIEAFANPWYDMLYLVSLVLLAFHLRHGFQSAFQTFGIRGQRYQALIDLVAILFWLVIPVLFAAMPIYFFLQLHS